MRFTPIIRSYGGAIRSYGGGCPELWGGYPELWGAENGVPNNRSGALIKLRSGHIH